MQESRPNESTHKWYEILYAIAILLAQIAVAVAAVYGIIFRIPTKIIDFTAAITAEANSLAQRTEIALNRIDNAVLAQKGNIRVPDLLGKTYGEAVPKIIDAGLNPKTIHIDTVFLLEAVKILEAIRTDLKTVPTHDSSFKYQMLGKKDTLELKAGLVVDQRPAPGSIEKLDAPFVNITVIGIGQR